MRIFSISAGFDLFYRFRVLVPPLAVLISSGEVHGKDGEEWAEIAQCSGSDNSGLQQYRPAR